MPRCRCCATRAAARAADAYAAAQIRADCCPMLLLAAAAATHADGFRLLAFAVSFRRFFMPPCRRRCRRCRAFLSIPPPFSCRHHYFFLIFMPFADFSPCRFRAAIALVAAFISLRRRFRADFSSAAMPRRHFHATRFSPPRYYYFRCRRRAPCHH